MDFSIYHIYVHLFRENSSKAQELLRYMHNIRLAASRVGHSGWARYDEQFRLKKKRHPSSSWGVIDYELWVMYININVPSSQPPQQPPSANTVANNSFRDGWSKTQTPRFGTGPQIEGQGPKPNYGARKGFKPSGCCYAFNKGSCSQKTL